MAMAMRLPPDQATSSILLHEEVIRAPEDTTLMQTRPPKKTSHSADDIPISSTYHRAHSAEVAEQESKRQEEQQMEAEEREREIREYKAAMGLS
ncbi:hypothetical protein BBO99_00001630 [Phytophthora kernoviae]|uniref:Uncharacterized protein n=2 Tax=Phytophthora kernoviae TaxID=325452 RepID=A0A3R7JGB1_9STRA|nr:hypothetical protein G195_002225 [Phytophthora kernoviae 00238/432]KAG2531257.1 hypothetical protein JM16_001188 [Phytophthora kernoviae]KAG2531872.1 hypothetical protein JM18_001547 [Phytophthora kernoviae]RLN45669.1 hypothetical protein BBI17_001400 [Phytophthora kernoviae]RLN84026.1 hypothetical protein BBO99_00001630 [Phytophthora kernoviae]